MAAIESTCVRDRRVAGTKDWKLIESVVASDFTLVTHLDGSILVSVKGPARLARLCVRSERT
jgi:hypothetical protein